VVAIASAERGDFVAVGGTVKGLHVEGLIPRLATLRPEDLPLVPLGPLPAEAAPPHQLLSQVLVRFDVLPAWVRHKYFFTSIPPTPAAKSGGSN
jgi:hypothetical protein